MANSISYKETVLHIGDTLSLSYKIKEGDKVRLQIFKGVLINIKGNTDENRMITIRKISKIGIGVERIIPLASPHIASIKVDKKSNFKKAKLFFARGLTETELKRKLYAHADLKSKK
jgi:large subunit ribosomal protein L19